MADAEIATPASANRISFEVRVAIAVSLHAKVSALARGVPARSKLKQTYDQLRV